MKNTKNEMIAAVKAAVGKYGMENITTRKICEEIGVNDGLIYHYFRNVNELIRTAYETESTAIFEKLMEFETEAKGIPFKFRERNRLLFHRTWNLFVSDYDRTKFLLSYFHSVYFMESLPFHHKQTEDLANVVKHYFKDEENCVTALYLVMTMLYCISGNVAYGLMPNTPETEEAAFNICYGFVSSQVKDEILNS